MDEPSQERSRSGSLDRKSKKTKKAKKQPPQHSVDEFWDSFTTKFPGKVSGVLPGNIFARAKAAHEPRGVVHGQAALKSYDATRAECSAAVAKIAKECRRVNMRYRDPHYDIEFDLKWNKNDCLEGLVPGDGDRFLPNSVKRVPEIFENPKFTLDEATSSDVRQGNDGDCWFLSALCALGNKKGLIDRICVAKDEPVGVYGFVFHRDGEWTYTLIDDKLYLNSTDYDESRDEKFSWDQVFNRQDAEEEYRKAFQTGSRALYFAQCSNENETWLPLLEKAFAKAHGDYRAINGGFTGEAIEDLTGGVTTELFTTDILDKDKFWKEELLKVNDQFLFGCATGCFDDWKGGGGFTDRKGVVAMHAYSIMEAREINGERLVKIRNPWGKSEWQGAWSDGSSEWTPEWMQTLKHRFGNDGIFWISYKDLLRRYQSFDRTRLFGDEWTVTQQWTTVDVPWTADYNDTKFTIKITKPGPIVIVLSQLDDRYFRGLQGQYEFSLHFRLDKYGESDYIVRSHGNYLMSRSVSTDLELEPGTYSVLMKITAKRYKRLPTPEQVLRANCQYRQEKLVQIGLAYDLAHARGQIKETEEEKKRKAEYEARVKAEARQKLRDETKAKMYDEWLLFRKTKQRSARRRQRVEDNRRKRVEARERAAYAQEMEHDADDQAIDDAGPAGGDDAQQAPEWTPQGTPVEVPPPDPEAPQASIPFRPADVLAAQPATPADQPLPTQQEQQPSPQDLTAQSKIDQFNRDLQSLPNATPNRPTPTTYPARRRGGGPVPPQSTAGPPTVAAKSDSDSDSDSVFSFDSELDMPPATDPSATPAPGSTAHHTKRHGRDDNDDDDDNSDEEEDENAEFADDPWNAVVVVGLRVFSMDAGVSVAVVRPKVGVEEEETRLDVDDPSKGVAEEVLEAETAAQGEGDGEGVGVGGGGGGGGGEQKERGDGQLEKEIREGRVEGVEGVGEVSGAEAGKGDLYKGVEGEKGLVAH